MPDDLWLTTGRVHDAVVERVARSICVAENLDPDEMVFAATGDDAGKRVPQWRLYQTIGRQIAAAHNALAT